MSKQKISISGHFPPGTEVAAVPRRSDFAPDVVPEDTTAVGKDGSVELSGLEPNAPYWIVGEVDNPGGVGRVVKSVSVVSKTKEIASAPPESRQKIAEALAAGKQTVVEQEAAASSPGSGSGSSGRTVRGARGTGNTQAKPSGAKRSRSSSRAKSSRTKK